MPAKYTPAEAIAHFWEKVAILEDDDACWLWTASAFDGYGRVRWKGRNNRAHRVAYELAYGDPGDLHVLHECDNPSCCNPRHLFLGTNLDNVRDKQMKGRSQPLDGENNGNAKLIRKQVDEIRRLFAEGNANKSELGRSFGVSQTQIAYIISGKNWRG